MESLVIPYPREFPPTKETIARILESTKGIFEKAFLKDRIYDVNSCSGEPSVIYMEQGGSVGRQMDYSRICTPTQ